MGSQTLRLWAKHGTINFLFLLQSRRNAAVQVATDVVLNLAAMSTSFLLAERFNGIGEWTKFEVFFMLGYVMLVNGALDSLFSNNIRMVSRRIGRGHLDHMLLQPQPLWRTFLTEGFAPFSQPFVIVLSVSLIVWSGSHLEVDKSASWYLLLFVSLLSSCVMVLSFQVFWGSLAFWAPFSAEEINSSSNRMVTQLGTYPLDAAPALLRGALVSAIPVGLVGWFPVRGLVEEDPTPIQQIGTPLAAGCYLVFALVIFSKGLKRYVRIGSQRYSGFGHRR